MKELLGNKALNMDELNQVVGGRWNKDTLTEEERTEWLALHKEAAVAQKTENAKRYIEAMENLKACKAKFDAKYGKN